MVQANTVINVIAESQYEGSFGELPGCSAAIAVAETAQEHEITVVVCPTDKLAETLAEEVRFFASKGIQVIWEPDTGTLPYDTESTPAERQSGIASARYNLLKRNGKVCFITSVPNVLKLGPSKEFIVNSTRFLEKGSSIDIDELLVYLEEIGYKSDSPEVEDPGEYVKHGSIVDVYPFGERNPCRIKIAGKKIERISYFDAGTQMEISETETARIMPARPYPWGDEERQRMISAYRMHHEDILKDAFYQSIKAGEEPADLSLYMPWFVGRLENHTDWIPDSSPILFVSGAKGELERHYGFIRSRYEDLSVSQDSKLITPEEGWITPDQFLNRTKSNKHIDISNEPDEINCGAIDINFSRQKNLDDTVEMLEPWVESALKTLICVNSETRVRQADLIATVLGHEPEMVDTWQDFLQSKQKICITKNAIDSGCFIVSQSILIIHESGIFGQPLLEGEDEASSHDFDSIKDLKNLGEGDPVVHERFGVGRFIDMKAVEIDGVAKDYMRIGYAEGATAFVGMDELVLVDRYGGLANEKTPLHVMGSESWREALSEAQNDALNTAKSLLSIKKLREKSNGIAFNKPNYLYNEFCSYFPYRETKDQLKAVQDVVNDMTAQSPMDRVICGDVGFGKTEVAMRASCLAVTTGYQVAVLVPTTLLSEQHFNTFSERFEMIGKKVVQLSSNSTASEERKALEQISNGEADVIIGTQRLLMQDVSWDSIGLLIIDEEHRFGVNDKEYLKSLRGHLDTLSMTATPIPRTMTMGLQGMRGFSVISTPPAKRLSVRTLLTDGNTNTLKEGIQRELARGGQIFLLHNNTKTIKSRAEELEALVPGLKVTYAHGKLSDREMTRRMRQFMNQEYDVLVATTIIEIGIDVPNANTIFIDNAQNMGLAQLHQLRGRVGRSSRQAYCYLVAPSTLSDTAKSRLEAITRASRLGEGFVLAYHDMEIRGAGELLGEKQSGNIQAVSFNLYMRLLSKAINAIDKGKSLKAIFSEEESTYIDLHATGLIPGDYIESSALRLSYYKKLSLIDDEDDLDQIKDEIINRFGEMPPETEDLFKIIEVRCAMKFVGMYKLNLGPTEGELVLKQYGSVLPRRLVNIIENIPGTEFSGARSIKISHKTGSLHERAGFALKMIQWLIK